MAKHLFRACVLVLTLTVASCSWTDALKILTPAANKGISADAEVTVGQKKEDNDIQTDVKFGGDKSESQTQNQQAEKIENTVVKDYSMPGWVLVAIIFLAGWAIPAPGVMFHGIANFIRKLWRK
jgi:hypothetical protein